MRVGRGPRRVFSIASLAVQVNLRSSSKMEENQLLDIGAVARACGLPPSTLRYYEERGLISTAGRRGLRRLYQPEVLQRLALITMGRTAGFSLDEIGSMLREDLPKLPRDLLEQKADELDRQIQHLTRLRDGLRHAAECRSPSHLQCPTFQRLLQVIQKKQARRTNHKR